MIILICLLKIKGHINTSFIMSDTMIKQFVLINMRLLYNMSKMYLNIVN